MRTSFIISAPTVSDCPDLEWPEFAFLGRSNTGKSSLLNALANHKIARTSGTPGRTQLINLFEVKTGEATFVLADLPGYGYARAPKAVKAKLSPAIEGYLAGRESLVGVMLLVDVRRGVQAEEALVAERMKTDRPGVRLMAIGTKVDKLPKAKRKPALHQIARSLGLEKSAVLGTSAKDRIGVDALRDQLVALSAE